MDRRTFLKTGAGASAGLMAANTAMGRDWTSNAPMRLPDSDVVIVDPRFAGYKAFTYQIERLWTGGKFTEGPVWIGDGHYLLFSDVNADKMLRWSEETGQVTVFRSPANHCNGNIRDRQGRLITCEHGPRRIVRTEYDGSVSVLADKYQGKRFNSPNDLAVHPDGGIWFTDPVYGLSDLPVGAGKAASELKPATYRIDPKSGAVAMISDEIPMPNGICFSPDFKKLYVVDTGLASPRGVYVFDVVDGIRATNRRLLIDAGKGFFDGIKCDVDGNIWAGAGWVGEGYDGAHCYASDATLLGKILLPETCANLCFGGVKGNRLFMTATNSLYAVYLETKGAALL